MCLMLDACEQPQEQQAASGGDKEEIECADWDYAQEELMAKTGIDLKAEMAKKLKEMEVQWRKEKEEANQAFQQERKKYEDQIESLQKQVMEQSMTMSMYSSITPEEFNNNGEEDVFGKKQLHAADGISYLLYSAELPTRVAYCFLETKSQGVALIWVGSLIFFRQKI